MTQSSTPRTWCGASGGSCPNGAVTEPPLPFGFDHASITITSIQVSGTQVALQVVITLYQTPSTAFTTLSTYVSSFTKAGP